jgi:hypothetical protein
MRAVQNQGDGAMTLADFPKESLQVYRTNQRNRRDVLTKYFNREM